MNSEKRKKHSAQNQVTDDKREWGKMVEQAVNKKVQEWMSAHDIIMEESFSEALHRYAIIVKNRNSLLLEDTYHIFGCNKTDVSRWQKNPHSTHRAVKRKKLIVIDSVAKYMDFDNAEKEVFANKAGLSCFLEREQRANETVNMQQLLTMYQGSIKELSNHSLVSERMLEYYKTGREPAKQALLAVLIALRCPQHKMKGILHAHEYCLSASVPADAVVLWYLNHLPCDYHALYEINQTLESLNLPLLMTKQNN